LEGKPAATAAREKHPGKEAEKQRKEAARSSKQQRSSQAVQLKAESAQPE